MRHFPFSALLLAGMTHLTCSAEGPTALRGGFVEGADLLLHVDAAGLQGTPFSKAVDGQKSEEAKAEAKAKADKFTAATGLTEDDMQVVVLSADIDNIDFESKDPKQFETLPALAAFQLGKAVTLEQVKAGIMVMQEESGKPGMEMSTASKDGLEVLVLKPANTKPDGPQEFYAVTSSDGKNVLFGLNTASLKDGLSRIDAAATSAPSPDMANAIRAIGNKQFRFAFVLPQVMRQKLQAELGGNAGGDPMGAMFLPLASTQALLISAHADQNLDLSILLDLGDAAKAQQATGMLQSMVMPMLMMGAGEQLGPNAMSVAQKVKLAPQEGAVSLSISLTPDDVKKAPTGAGGGMQMMDDADGM